jgi:hypothetical protein
MSALFDEDEESGAEKLRRAGIATGGTIFAAPASGAGEKADQVRPVLFHPPRGHDPRINDGPPPPPPPATFKERFRDEMPTTHEPPAKTIDDRFPKRHEMMRNVEPRAEESAIDTLKRELERREREERRRRRRN